MPDDPMLARIRRVLAPRTFTEQRMFGGTCFLIDGNMLAGTSKRGLLVRVGKDAHREAASLPHAKAMEMRGREMEGYIFVDPAGTGSEKDLKAWLARALAFVQTLPSKAAKAKRSPKKGGKK